MTNSEIQRLSAPVVQAYLDMEDELLRLIGEQLGRDKRLSDTSKWRIRQLARAGEVNRQALAIIDSYAGGISAEVAEAVLAAAEGEVGVLDEAMLSFLSEKGRMTDEQMQMMQAFERQSRQDLNIENASIAHGYAEALEEDCNLVNTVMGYQTQSTFVSAVNQIYNEAERQRVLDEMNAGAMSVVSGNESLQEATRKTIKRIAEKGIPGFVDKAGREWSPEAYVRMDLRSTMGNTARAAQDARCDRYGISLIEVSSHMGARPKCAPYQGRIFSRDGTRGVTEDINGRQIEYIPLSETSYGEPDGLFGINCGHQQYPFIPGVSLQRYYPYDEEQNAERYREFQQQRAMERKIRADKQECMMLQAAGDEEGLKEAAKKLRLDKEKYHDFNKAHGLGDHMENTQVYGYDKSKSMKTVWAEQEKQRLTNKGEDAIISSSKYAVPKDMTTTRAFREKFDKMTDDPDISREYYQYSKAMLEHRSGTNGEDLVYYNPRLKKWYVSDTGRYAGTPEYNNEILKGWEENKNNEIISFHNHPAGMPPSEDDLNSAFKHGYAKGYTIGHDGRIFEYTAPIDIIPEETYNYYYSEFLKQDMSEYEAQIATLDKLQPLYGFTYKEIK